MLRVRHERCRVFRLAVCCAFWLCSALAPRPGLAQDDAPREYGEAVQQALQELEANNLAEALAEFRRAHQIFPNARSLRGLGMVEFDLRDYESAARHLREALASSVKPLSGTMRSAAEELLARTLRYLGELHIVTEPRGARVFVDGSAAQPRADGTLSLNPGDHVIEVKATGYFAETRPLQVSGGDRRELIISLRALAGSPAPGSSTSEQLGPAPGAQQTPARSETLPVYRKWWVWTLVAVAVVGGATTAAILLAQRKDPASRPVQGTNTVDGVHLHALSHF